MGNKTCLVALCLSVALLFGCSMSEKPEESKTGLTMPEKVQYTQDGEPALKVYVVETEQIETMPLEEYLCGVLAVKCATTGRWKRSKRRRFWHGRLC